MKHKKNSRGRNRMRRLDGLARKAYKEFRAGMSLKELGVRYRRDPTSIHHLFAVRGFAVLPTAERKARLKKAQLVGAAHHRSALDGLVAKMHAEYMNEGLSVSAVGRRYNRTTSAIRNLFEARNLALRESTAKQNIHLSDGRFAPAPLKTAEEISKAILSANKLCIPDAIRNEWRDWSIARRSDFISRLRRHLGIPGRPDTPFSSNVEPFDYGSVRAHAIVDKMNIGRDSRHKAGMLRLCSQGVIFEDSLWFWSKKAGYVRGPWTQGQGRPALHIVIWERAHGMSLPSGHVIRFVDRNPNNHAPDNLVIATRDDLARENQASSLFKKSRELTSLLLNANQGGNTNEFTLIKNSRDR